MLTLHVTCVEKLVNSQTLLFSGNWTCFSFILHPEGFMNSKCSEKFSILYWVDYWLRENQVHSVSALRTGSGYVFVQDSAPTW